MRLHRSHPDETPIRRARAVAIIRMIFGAIIVTLLLAVWWHWDDELMQSWQESAGPLPFFGAMALLPAFGVPMTPFFIIAGATFGIWTALIGSLCAVSLNLMLCYRIAHSGLRPQLERIIHRTRYTLPDLREHSKRAVPFTVLVKIAPGVPAFAKNYIISLAGVSFPIYFLISLPFTALFGASFIVLGDSAVDQRPAGVAIAVGMLLLLTIGGAIWWQVKSRDVDE